MNNTARGSALAASVLAAVAAAVSFVLLPAHSGPAPHPAAGSTPAAASGPGSLGSASVINGGAAAQPRASSCAP